jgi:signal transduction histidine kinase
MEFTAVSLNDHLAESVSLLQPMANSQRVIIRTSLSESVPDVVADQRSVKQIALNLLSNAIRYTPSGGQIVVSTSYEPIRQCGDPHPRHRHRDEPQGT